MKMWCLIMVASLIALVGCREDPLSASRARVARGLVRLRDGLESFRIDESLGSLRSEINHIQDESVKRQCWMEWAAIVYSIDLGKALDSRPGSVMRLIRYVDSFTSQVMMEDQARSAVDRYEGSIRFLLWFRSQLQAIHQPKPYPNGVKWMKDPKGGGHWLYRKHAKNDLDRFVRWLECHNEMVMEYESMLTWREGVLLALDCRSVGEEMAQSLQKQFRSYVGRPLRSKEECRKDMESKRFTEFAAYVPGKERLIEEWSGLRILQLSEKSMEH